MSRIVVTPAEEDEVIVAGAEGPAPDPAPDPAPEPEPAAGKTPRAAFREPTLGDLEPQPMPLAQRVVIIAAVVCIIGALIYYFVAMR